MLSIFFVLLGTCESFSFPLEKLSDPSYNISYFITTKINGQKAILGLDLTSQHSFIFPSIYNCTDYPDPILGIPKPENAETNEITYKTLTFQVFEANYSVFENTSLQLLTVQKCSNLLKNFKFHGIIGLAYNPMSENPTFTEKLGTLASEKGFSLVLNSAYDSEVHSLIEFGIIDIKKYFEGKKRKKELTTEKDKWELHLSRISLGEHNVNLDTHARFDINSEEILVPSQDFDRITPFLPNFFAEINKNQEFPCANSNYSELFSLVFTIERTKFPMRNLNLIRENNGVCKLLLKKHSEKFWVFGEPFFQDYFINFSYGWKTLTFFQLDKFTPGFYEISIVAFVIASFFISLCVGWCMTSRTSKSNKKD